MNAYYASDLALLSNLSSQAESLLPNLDQTAKAIVSK